MALTTVPSRDGARRVFAGQGLRCTEREEPRDEFNAATT